MKELESRIEQSKLSRIVDEFKQWREPHNTDYFEHYAANAIKIILGIRPIDYRVVSHENALVHSFFYGIDDRKPGGKNPNNKLSNSYLYDFEDGDSD